MSQEELTQAQKDSLVPILNALEEHYIRVRKSQVDKLQEIENQLVTFKDNELVVSGLIIIQRETKQCIEKLETYYKTNLYMLESYVKRLESITEGYFW